MVDMVPMMSARVELHERWLRVRFGADRHADFHLRWLRHNCDVDRHPLTRERTVCSSELPDDLRAVAAYVDEDDLLLVRWAYDDRESRYPLRWLEEHAYALDRVDDRPSNDVEGITIRRRDEGLLAVAERALGLLERHGAAIVRRDPRVITPAEEETEELIDAFSAAGLRVVGTHFGRIEDLRTDNSTNENVDQLGYTDAAIDLHTDQPFLEHPPHMQLLQGIRQADAGGESALVDARAAAAYLRSIDEEAHALLTRTPVRFHRKQKGFEKVLDASILTDESAGFEIRWSYFTLAPYRLPFARMEAWYCAHDRFARLVRDPRNQLRFSLGPGDFVIYDNRRMLHGRTAFRGARWVRGVYFDCR
ncbi:MAG: gamma-butyrobetaine dioxygenase [Labilithrix sp.]|nr:gamma-butyrobetaine dioxygenase [Labilithrix sp.]